MAGAKPKPPPISVSYLEEGVIHNKNHWPQQIHLHLSGKEYQKLFALIAAYLLSFSEKKMHFTAFKKHYELWIKNIIPWLFTDFDSIKDFPWLNELMKWKVSTFH